MFGAGVSETPEPAIAPSRLLGIPILFIFISRWLINVLRSIIFLISFPLSKLQEPLCACRVSFALTKGAREQARQDHEDELDLEGNANWRET